MIYRHENSVTENTTAKWNISNLNSLFSNYRWRESLRQYQSSSWWWKCEWLGLSSSKSSNHSTHFRYECFAVVVVKKNALYLSVNIFSTKVLIGDTIFYVSYWRRVVIFRGHPSHAKVKPFAEQRKYIHFSVILRLLVVVWSRESNPWPPALQSSALSTE